MNGLKTAPYIAGDEKKILELFKIVYGKEMSPEYWRWRFIDNPAGKNMIELCWDEQILAGHYAVAPVKMSINGQQRLTALSMTTMTHPDYRKMGIFVKLAKALYQRIEQEGVTMVWGFPNQNSFHGFMTKLNWFPLTEIPRLEKTDLNLNLALRKNRQVERITTIDKSFDRLWERLDKRNINMVIRDASFIKWRYLDIPVNTYEILALKRLDGVDGYVVIKQYREGDLLNGEIIDLLALNVEDAAVLAGYAVDYLAWLRVDRVTTWMNPSFPCYEVFNNLGFTPSENKTHIGARVNSPAVERSEIASYDDWYVTMGDSDVY